MTGAVVALAMALTMRMPAVSPPPDTTRDTVWVASNRRRVAHGFVREATDSLWFGIYVTRRVTDAPALGALSPMHVTRIDSLALTEAEWRQRLAVPRGTAVVYVHGYSSSPGTAVAQGVQVTARGGSTGPLVVFLWPTHDRYVAPPSPQRAYTDDAAAAAHSVGAFARVLRIVHDVSPGAILVAHSMGTRIALRALGDSGVRMALTSHPLRAIGLFSPDVGLTALRDTLAAVLPTVSARTALYGTSRDYLLAAATLVNGEARAARMATRGPALPGIELVDASLGERAEPRWLTWLGPRHSVRWAAAALVDFFGIVASGAPPACRVDASTALPSGEGRWRLVPGALPGHPLDPACRPGTPLTPAIARP